MMAGRVGLGAVARALPAARAPHSATRPRPAPALLPFAASDGPLALAASKASVGHAEAGAGLVGCALAVLSAEGRALPRLLHLRTLNPHVQATLATACKDGAAVSAPRAPAAFPCAAPHGRLTAGVSAFAFQVGRRCCCRLSAAERERSLLGVRRQPPLEQLHPPHPPTPHAPPCPPTLQGTNAHAVLAALDSEAMQPLFEGQPGAADGRPLPLWQRASFWLLPPASALLGRCLGKVSTGGVRLQGDLRRPEVAALVRGAGSAGGWAVAAEAACAAAAMLAAGANGKQQAAVALVAISLAPAAGDSLAAAALLTVVADARAGSVSVAAGDSQVLAATMAAAVELPTSEPADSSHALQAAQRAALVPSAAPASSPSAATAELEAPGAQQVAQQQGLFLQPALLQAAAQLQQLPAADGSAAKASEPAGVGCLAPSTPDLNAPGSPSSGSGAKSRSSARLWRASATQHSLRVSSGRGNSGSLLMSGVQRRELAARPKAASAGAEECSGCSYSNAWQMVQPAAADSCGAALRHTSSRRRAAAVLSSSGSGRGSSRKAGLMARLPAASSSAQADAGQAACFRAMQLLQTAAAQGDSSISLTAAAPATATTPALAGCSAAGTTSAALFAMLRCAASELPAVRFSAGSIDEASAALAPTSGGSSSSSSSSGWAATYGCYGQQQSAGGLLAARLLPSCDEQQPDQHAPAAAGQSWGVSGGTGALGLLVASWLQQLQAAGVLLLGRSGRLASDPPAGLLEAADSCLTLRMCDAAAAEDAAAATLPAACGQPLASLVHAGGILQDAALAAQTLATIRAVHAPKTAGLRRLLAAAGHTTPLHRALLFSSIAAVTGPAGSSNYAAANAALDAAAAQLQLQGKRSRGRTPPEQCGSRSVPALPPTPPTHVAQHSFIPPAGLTASTAQWGAWAAIGMVATNTAVHRAMQRSGVGMLQPAAGLAAMHALLAAPAARATAQLAAIPFAWRRFMQAPRNAAAFYYGEHLPADAADGQRAAAGAHLALPGGAAGLPVAFGQPGAAVAAAPAVAVPSPKEVLQRVLAVVAAVHGAALEPGQPLVAAGLDSLGELGALEFRAGMPAWMAA